MEAAALSLSIVVPTIGDRESLRACLDSFVDDLTDDDQLIVVSETRTFLVENIMKDYLGRVPGDLVWGYPDEPCLGCYGHGLRNYALDTIVGGSHIWSIDDDDVALPGALETLRACQADVPVIFRARWGEAHPAAGVELWMQREVRLGNVATPMILSPVGESRWGLDYFGDHSFCVAAVAEFGDPIWRDELVALVRPV